MCVFMLQQYEAQLCDLLTFSKTSSAAKTARLTEETHGDAQLLAGRACASGTLAVQTRTATNNLPSVPQVSLTHLAERSGLDLAEWRQTEALMSSPCLPRQQVCL